MITPVEMKTRERADESRAALSALVGALHEYKYALMDELYGAHRAKGVLSGGWRSARLGDLLAGSDDPLWGKAEIPGDGKAVTVITPASVDSLRFLPDACVTAKVGDADRVKYSAAGADIVMAGKGARAGACAIMPVFFEGGVVSPDCLRLRAVPERIEPFYCANVLHYLYRRGDLERVKRGDAIDAALLLQLEIAYPPPDAQKKIAGEMLNLSALLVKALDAAANVDAVCEGLCAAPAPERT
ncbi:MAG: hypothetical protein KBA15_15350 [Spirochaetes bacterium]|nr:hypothetical protein [Spirochaetota bacterium]